MQGWPNTACRPCLLQSASVKLRKSDVITTTIKRYVEVGRMVFLEVDGAASLR